ncbi:MAG TPA: hypothetical protein VEI02_15030, partial [Planctomycetota bacterium]|nr:hypothetical protein [Planctomycetota bacterium]
RVNAGEDFGAIIKTTTDDAGSRAGDPPGQYVLYDKTPVPGVPGARPRDGMVPGFGYVAFALAVGETQIVPYDPEVSPFGFHVVRRTQ